MASLRLLLGLGMLWTLAFASELEEFRDYLQAHREVLDTRHQTQLASTRDLVVRALNGQEDAATATGNLDRVLLLRDFRDAVASGEDPEPPALLREDSAFVHTWDTWSRLREEHGDLHARQLFRLYSGYDKALETLQQRLTRDGEIATAVRVQEERQRLQMDPELQTMRDRVARLEAEREAQAEHEAARIEGGSGRIMTQLSAHMVLHLGFDRLERMRNRTPDQSRGRNHGEVHNAEWNPEGKRGGAMRFNGRDSRVVVENNPALQLTGDLTIGFWIKPEAFVVRRNPLAKSYGGEGTFTLETNGTLNYYYGTAGRDHQPYQGVLMDQPLPLGQWTHLVLVRDLTRKTVTWYANGEQVRSEEARFPQATASRANLVIGRGYAGAFQGELDEVMILNKALEPHEVRALYRAVGGE